MRKFFKTVAVVTAFSVIEKCLGFLYRIYLSRSIGQEGVGLYQVALSVFALLLTVSCSGTPVTVSRLMTKYRAENDEKRVNGVLSSGLTVTFFISAFLCGIFLTLKNDLGFLFSDGRCVDIFTVVLPGLIFTSVYAVLRGVFWGNKAFLPYSIIELLEEICMIVAGVILVSSATNVFEGAYRAGVAVLISYVFSFSVALACFFIKKGKIVNPFPELKPLVFSAAPVTAMRTVNSLAVSLVSVILPMRLLAAGYTSGQAMSFFGAAVGEAIPILFIPTTLIGSFTLVLVPEISENFYGKNYMLLKKDVEKALKFSTLLTCLFVPVFTVCGEELGVLIFGSTLCGEYLSASAFLMVFMSLSSVTTSVLNSIGLEHKTMVYFVISACLMLACVWVLPAFLGIYALLVGFTFVYGLTTVLNLKLLEKSCKYKPEYKRYVLKTSIAVIPAVIFGFVLERLLLGLLGTLFTLLVTSALVTAFTLAVCFGLGVVDFGLIRGRIIKKGGSRRLKPLKVRN